MRNSFLFLSTFILWSCSKSANHFSRVEWSGKGQKPKVDFVFDSQVKPVREGSNQVLLTPQIVDNVVVENSFYKKITGGDGETTFISAKYLAESEIERLKKEISQIRPNLSKFREVFTSLYPPAKKSKWISTPEIFIADTVFGSKAVVKMDYQGDNGYIYSVQMSPNQNIIQMGRVGSLFEAAHALVYPEGPTKSNLMEVLLNNLIGDGTLKNLVLRISSESPEVVTEASNSFKFTPPDHRFDQVQVYYFVDRFLNWINVKTGIVLPFQVNIVTHVGYPKKTSAAYYYHGEVRLGEGDDEVFSRIMYDQSIVTHEFGHALIDSLAGLPFEKEGGSINEGFADFFACSHLGSPFLGEVAYKKGPYKRRVDTKITLQEANGGLYHDSGIISGTLWDIRTAFGNDPALKFAREVLVKLTPASDFKDLGLKLAEAAKTQFRGEQLDAVNSILKNRGWL